MMDINRNSSKTRNLSVGILTSSFISLAFAASLVLLSIPITVVLPTTAPIWVGIATMTFMVLE